ncbi:leucine-rich repeat domain-containing protein [[Eubacterium] hominis]|uniref:leucine-rich repeat domain-containing protein n=1 Tax=[Eubacterium] hominis TaxID=2764325 RepID=UPI003A4DE7A0
MNNKKKQGVTAAMATALGVSVMMSPVAVYAQEEDSAIIMQENKQQDNTQGTKQDDISISKQEVSVNENLQNTNTSNSQAVTDIPVADLRSNEAITDPAEAQQAIQAALDNYPVSNETTIDEIDDFLEKTFINTGKLADCRLSSFDKTKATVDTVGNIIIEIGYVFLFRPPDIYLYGMNITIPRLPKAGEVAINDKNFPDGIFRKYVKETFDTSNDNVLSIEELENIYTVNVLSKSDIESLKGIEYFPDLRFLYCNNTKITELDVSKNLALQKLDCSNTLLTSLDVSKNKKLTQLSCNWNTEMESLTVQGADALQSLICTNSGLKSLDVTHNELLKDLNCYNNKQMSILLVNGAQRLEKLSCFNSAIQTLDVSKLKKLEELNCYENADLNTLNVGGADALAVLRCNDTNINELNISNNKSLTHLYTSSTNLTDLDVSKNTALKFLFASNTKISKLDIHLNKVLKQLVCGDNKNLTSLIITGADALEKLSCDNTSIRSLDVSQNKNLSLLECQNTQLVWLDIGDNINLKTISKNTTMMKISVTGNTFNIKDLFPDLNLQKVTITSNGHLNTTTGVVTIMKPDQDVTYMYQMGTSGNGTEFLTVALTLDIQKEKSVISIENDISKTYDGKQVDDPMISRHGSQKEVTFTYEQWNGSKWIDLNEVPIHVGVYRVQAHVASDDFWLMADSEKVEFTITRAVNNWIAKPTIEKWTYGQSANDPTASSLFGDVSYSYSNSRTGIYTSNVPTDAGTWYVKATVAGTDNYTGLEEIVMFQIQKADNEWINQLEIIGWTYEEKANMPTATSKYGNVTYTYSDTKAGLYTDKVPHNAGTWYVKATVAGTDNYTGLEEIVMFQIQKADNEWTSQPGLIGWTYGEKASMPTATSKYGNVTYTYSDSKIGTFTSNVPVNAGTWYIKASVEETGNYTELEYITTFMVAPKHINDDIIPDIQSDEDVAHLIIKDGDRELIKGKDYRIDKQQKDNDVIITITFHGNYTGTATRSYIIDIEKSEEIIKDTNSVSTGDHNQTGFFAMISIFFAGCFVYLTGKRRKKNE